MYHSITTETKRRAKALLCLVAGLAYFLPQGFSQEAPDPDRNKKNSPYFGNPHERKDKEEIGLPNDKISPIPATLTDSSTEKEEMALKDIFNPRIYSDVFTTGLPSLLTKGQWRLHFNPKLGDFFGDDYVRLRTGLSYNFSDYFETTVEVGNYFSNPFENANRAGFSDIEISAKYSWWDVKDSGYNLSIGYSADFPLSNPPFELSDGYARFEPSVSISHEINSDPSIMLYLNVAYRFIGDSPFKTDPIIPIPRNQLRLRPGIIYYPGGSFRYAAEIEYRTTSTGSIRAPLGEFTDYLGTREHVLAFEATHEIFFSPSITWFPTEKIRKGFYIPGNWDLSLRLDIPIVEETYESLGVSLRFRWYYDYQKHITRQLNRLRIWDRDEER